MPLQDRQLDFEDFSSDTEKLSAILKRTEVSSQKHKLSYEYYRARKFVLLYPSLLACLAVGILSFTVTTDAIKRHMKVGNTQVEDVITLVVGCLGFFIGMNLLLMNQWDFSSRESMHLAALMELDTLSDKVRFWKMDRRVGHGATDDDDGDVTLNASGRSFNEIERKALGVVEAPDSHKTALVVASGKTLKKVEKEIKQKTKQAKKTEVKRSDVSRFSGFNGAYNQVIRSCKSDIPTPISRPFDLFESRLECMSLGHLGVIWDTRMRRNQIMRLAAVEIYNEVTGYWAWPLSTPDIDHVIDRSMKRVARLISKDYRAPIKVECCGFTIFRCCCRKRNPKSGLLTGIVDAMEAREREMWDVRGVGNFIDSGDRPHGGRDILEEDAYEAERQLQRMEDEEYSYYSRDRNQSSYYDDEETAYTETGNSYSRGVAKYDVQSRGRRTGRAPSRRQERLPAWDEASESQWG